MLIYYFISKGNSKILLLLVKNKKIVKGFIERDLKIVLIINQTIELILNSETQDSGK